MDSTITTSSTFLLKSVSSGVMDLILDEKKLVGSSIESDFVLEGCAQQHLMVRRIDRVVTVMDLGNGKTFLNEKELAPRRMYILEEGDKLTLETFEFTFQILREGASNEQSLDELEDEVSDFPEEIKDMLEVSSEIAYENESENDEQVPQRFKQMSSVSELKSKYEEHIPFLARKLLPYCFKRDEIIYNVKDGIVFDDEKELFDLELVKNNDQINIEECEGEIIISSKELSPISGLETKLGKIFSFLYKNYITDQSSLDFNLDRLIDQYELSQEPVVQEPTGSLSEIISSSKERVNPPPEKEVTEPNEVEIEKIEKEQVQVVIKQHLLGPASRFFSFMIDLSISFIMLSYLFEFVKMDDAVSYYSAQIYDFFIMFFDGFSIVSFSLFKFSLLLYICFAFQSLLFSLLLGQTLGQTFSLPSTSRSDKGIILRGKAIFRQILALSIVVSIFDLLLFVKRPTLKETLSRSELCASNRGGGLSLFIFSILFFAATFYQIALVYPEMNNDITVVTNKQIRPIGSDHIIFGSTNTLIAESVLNEFFVIPKSVENNEYILADKERGKPVVFSFDKVLFMKQMFFSEISNDPLFLVRYPQLSSVLFTKNKKMSILSEIEYQNAIKATFLLSQPAIVDLNFWLNTAPLISPYFNLKTKILSIAGVGKTKEFEFLAVMGKKYLSLSNNKRSVYLPLTDGDRVITVRSPVKFLSPAQITSIEDRFLGAIKFDVDTNRKFKKTIPFILSGENLTELEKREMLKYLLDAKNSLKSFDKYKDYYESEIDKVIKKYSLDDLLDQNKDKELKDVESSQIESQSLLN